MWNYYSLLTIGDYKRNTGINSRLPSLQLLFSMFSRKDGGNLHRNLCTSPPLTENSSPHCPTPPHSHLHTTHKKLSSLYATQLSVLYVWLFQARCGQLFTIINQNQQRCQHWLKGKKNHRNSLEHRFIDSVSFSILIQTNTCGYLQHTSSHLRIKQFDTYSKYGKLFPHSDFLDLSDYWITLV